MSIPSSPSDEPLRAELLRKLLLLALTIVGAALVLAVLLNQIHKPSLFLEIFFSDLLLGLVAGATARLLFRDHIGLLRFASACAVFLLGTILLGYFTGWHFGIDLVKIPIKTVDWADLGQLLLGVGIIILTLQAWQKPADEVVVVPRQRHVVPLPQAIPQVQPQPKRQPRRRARRPARPQVQPATAITVPKPVKPRRKRLSRRSKPQLQFHTDVEHRCPYCLEPVKPHDPRGIVECKICHTLHHADCWAITGTCQVPHLNT